jgi:hypothetical protein
MPRSVLLVFISLYGLLLPTKTLASEYDWTKIGSLELSTLKCPDKKKPRIASEFGVAQHLCEDKSGRPNGPFIAIDESGKVQSKGVTTSDSLVIITKRIEYFYNGLTESRGVEVNGLKAGTWEYWWISGKRRMSIEFESVELIACLVAQHNGRRARAVSVVAWDENGNEVPPFAFEVSCSDLGGVKDCAWPQSWRKDVEEYFDSNPGGMISIRESPLGLEWYFIRGLIVKALRDKGLAIAYSGQSDQVLLVLTAPINNPEESKSSHYRIRITRTTECPNHACEMSLTAFRMDAPIKSGKIMWPELIGVDDDVTQSVARILDFSLRSFQDRVEAAKRTSQKSRAF